MFFVFYHDMVKYIMDCPSNALSTVLYICRNWDSPPQNAGYVVYLYVNWGRIPDPGNSVFVVSVSQVEASCMLSILCSCGLLGLSCFHYPLIYAFT